MRIMCFWYGMFCHFVAVLNWIIFRFTAIISILRYSFSVTLFGLFLDWVVPPVLFTPWQTLNSLLATLYLLDLSNWSAIVELIELSSTPRAPVFRRMSIWRPLPIKHGANDANIACYITGVLTSTIVAILIATSVIKLWIIRFVVI